VLPAPSKFETVAVETLKVDNFFRMLAERGPVSGFPRKVPFYTKRSMLLADLFLYRIPLARAVWLVRVQQARTSRGDNTPAAWSATLAGM